MAAKASSGSFVFLRVLCGYGCFARVFDRGTDCAVERWQYGCYLRSAFEWRIGCYRRSRMARGVGWQEVKGGWILIASSHTLIQAN
jgi:hypothetical protein